MFTQIRFVSEAVAERIRQAILEKTGGFPPDT